MKENNQNKANNITLNNIDSCNITLNITGNLELKIRALAHVFPRNEWSGVLFYKINKEKSNKKDFTNMVYDAIDLYPLDSGSGTYTKFEIDNMDLPMYMVDNGYDDDDDIFMGLIHSHPTFSTNASGTDFNTIKNECTERGVFLSLIVNNEGTYSAYMSRMVKKDIKMECVKECMDFGGNIIKQNISKSEIMNQVECYKIKVNRFYGLEDFISEANKLKSKYEKSIASKPVLSVGNLFGDDMRTIGASMDLFNKREGYFDIIKECDITYSDSLKLFISDFIKNCSKFKDEPEFLTEVFSKMNSKNPNLNNIIKSVSDKITKTSCSFDFTIFIILSIMVIRIHENKFGPTLDSLLNLINKNHEKIDCELIYKLAYRANEYILSVDIIKEYENIKTDYKNLAIYDFIINACECDSYRNKYEVLSDAKKYLKGIDDLNQFICDREFTSLISICRWHSDKTMMELLYKKLPLIILCIDDDCNISDIGLNKTYTLFNTVFCMDNNIEQSFVDMNIVKSVISGNYKENTDKTIDTTEDLFECNSAIMGDVIKIYNDINESSEEIDNQAIYSISELIL